MKLISDESLFIMDDNKILVNGNGEHFLTIKSINKKKRSKNLSPTGSYNVIFIGVY